MSEANAEITIFEQLTTKAMEAATQGKWASVAHFYDRRANAGSLEALPRNVAKKLIKNRPLDLTSGVAKRPLVALEKKVVKEVKRFAGKEIVVEKTVIVDRNVRPVEVVASAKGEER